MDLKISYKCLIFGNRCKFQTNSTNLFLELLKKVLVRAYLLTVFSSFSNFYFLNQFNQFNIDI